MVSFIVHSLASSYLSTVVRGTWSALSSNKSHKPATHCMRRYQHARLMVALSPATCTSGYSGTPLKWTPLWPKILPFIARRPLFGGYMCSCCFHIFTVLCVIIINVITTFMQVKHQLLTVWRCSSMLIKEKRRKFESSLKWVTNGETCSDANRINLLEQQHRGDSKECLRQVFIENFINKKPQRYSQDWKGLIELLDDVRLETLAKKVKDAVSRM